MRETDIIVQHRKKWLKRSPQAFYLKIPDSLGLGSKRPFDVLIVDEGSTFAIEFKLHKSHTAFSLAKIKPHQLAGLRSAQQNGAKSSVFIAVRATLDIDTKQRFDLRKRRISFDLEFELDEIVELVEQGDKSIDILSLIKDGYGTD